MRPQEILNRLTGISTPLIGAQWTPATLDRDVAQAVIAFLEDRRVLYEEYAGETPDYCVRSVLEIRRFLTDKLAAGGIGNELADSLRAMRASCRRFIAVMERIDRHGRRGHGPYDWAFNQALGELRAGIGLHVAVIAVAFDVPVDEPLASVLPPAPSPDDDDIRGDWRDDPWRW